MQISYTILSVLAVGTLTACVSANVEDAKPRGVAQFDGDARLGEQVDRICFGSGIDGFSDTTRDTVVVQKGVDDFYLIETVGSCFRDSSVNAIGIDGTMGCVRRSDVLTISSSFFNAPSAGMGCTIRSIHKWNKDANAPQPLP